MAKAAWTVVVVLFVHGCVRSQETSSLTCSETAGCGANSKSSALLQVDRSREKAHLADAHDPNEEGPVTITEMLRHTAPLQTQIDKLKGKVGSLEKWVHKRTSSDSDGSLADSHPHHDEINNEEDDSSDSKGSKDDVDDEDEENANSMDDGEDDDLEDEDWAHDPNWGDEGHREHKDDKNDKDDKGSRRRRTPDWDGVAPGEKWNGLEEVKAKDHGDDASWKETAVGNGTGVVSGRKYTGEHPYETMMDVDFLIDSNPQPTKKPASPPSAPKSAPKYGGKTSPKAAPKTSPMQGGKTSAEEPAKSSPKRGGKDRIGRTSGGKTSPDEKAKASPKHGSKGKDAEMSGGKSNAERRQSLAQQRDLKNLGWGS